MGDAIGDIEGPRVGGDGEHGQGKQKGVTCWDTAKKKAFQLQVQ